MKIAFAGTPHFAASALKDLLDNQFDINFVLTQPDKPAGRGMHMQASPVKQLAIKNNITVYQPLSLKKNGIDAFNAQLVHELLKNVDVLIVAAYGLLLPESIVNYNVCLNIHASILPKWRGAAPIHRAIQAGDTQSGISIMHMDKGLDTGDILHMEYTAIQEYDTTQSLHDKLAILGGQSIIYVLDNLERLMLNKQKQSEVNISYAHKIQKTEANLDLSQNIYMLERNIRAFNPFPVANVGQYKIWQAQVYNNIAMNNNIPNGTIVKLDNAIHISCSNGQGILQINELQIAGKKRMCAQDFLQGYKLEIGQIFI